MKGEESELKSPKRKEMVVEETEEEIEERSLDLNRIDEMTEEVQILQKVSEEREETADQNLTEENDKTKKSRFINEAAFLLYLNNKLSTY